MSLLELKKKRATAFDNFSALASKETLTPEETTDYPVRLKAITDLDDAIQRATEASNLAGAQAEPVAGQEGTAQNLAFPKVESDPYLNEGAAQARGLGSAKGLRAIAAVKMFHAGGNNIMGARAASTEFFGERHPITQLFTPRALVVSVGASGGFIVPPDYMNEIIELLRPKTVVRSSGPRVIPMPRGTMTLPSQTSAATATYQGETTAITASQQTVGQIIASYKKLTALVPVTNDMMRYADPAADAFVRDDLVKVIALREDLAFITGDGTANSPRGWLSFANGWALANGGTAGNWLTTANSTAAVDGPAGNPLTGNNGGNFITSTLTFNLATVATELGGMVQKLDSANIEDDKRVWFMNPRSKNYLYNVQNSLGVYVYRDEMNLGKLLGYPFKTTTQIPTNIWDTTGTNKDCSFVFLVEMTEDMILDSMSLELAVTREGSYIDSSGTTVSAFQNDQTLIRAIAEHDHQMRHDSAVAVAQFVRWAPQIT